MVVCRYDRCDSSPTILGTQSWTAFSETFAARLMENLYGVMMEHPSWRCGGRPWLVQNGMESRLVDFCFLLRESFLCITKRCDVR